MYKVFLAGFHEFKYKHSIENLRKFCPRKAQKRDKAKPKKFATSGQVWWRLYANVNSKLAKKPGARVNVYHGRIFASRIDL